MGTVAALFLAVQLVFGQTAQREPAKIGVGDVVQLTVVGYAEFTGELTVVSDGSVSAAAIGRLEVAGLTLAEAQGLIRERLVDYIRDPQAFLSFVTQANAFVYVAGFGPAEGRVPYTEGLDVRRVFAGADLGTAPDKLVCSVYRSGKRLRRFDLKPLLDGESDEWNGPLEPGDLLVVGRRATIRVWFIESFKTSGEILIFEGTTLAQAVAQVGGVFLNPPLGQADAASPLREKMQFVVRRGDRTHRFKSTIEQDAHDFVLQAGDTVSLDVPKLMNVVVAGEVVRPGGIVLEAGSDALVAIAKSLGVSERGSLDGVLVFRGRAVHRLDLSARLAGEPAEPFELESDDLVVVPENRRFVYVLGEVSEPGRYAIPDGQTLTAADALAIAGGLNLRGTNRRVALVRPNEDGVYTARVFNIDEFLKDGKTDSNPVMRPGDVLFFGQPKGITFADVSRYIGSLLLIESLFGR
ncbi:MAG: polysaccharide biosynthesis/export family protein [Armatimonadetes bacterium]|nr:polysaccharide biosynthesis/export family protein [Armatimonadota bacterium]